MVPDKRSTVRSSRKTQVLLARTCGKSRQYPIVTKMTAIVEIIGMRILGLPVK